MSKKLTPKDISFLIVGAQKSGTTWLANMLKQHPQIFIPAQKEVFYFNRNFQITPDLLNYQFDKPVSWYLSYFEDAKSEQILGEASVGYLDDEIAAKKIFEFNPDIKIIIILRNPVNRSISNYFYYIQDGIIDRVPFKEAILEQKPIITRSLYYRQVKRYLDIFPKNQVKIMFYDDLIENNKNFLLEIEMFLNVPCYIPENIDEKSNVTGEPRFYFLKRLHNQSRIFIRKYRLHFLNDLVRKLGLSTLADNLRALLVKPLEVKPIIQEEVYTYLMDLFIEDICKLEELLNCDLSSWKN